MPMDLLTLPNPKCRLYWCLVEFIDWRYSQACWYFDPAVRTITATYNLLSGSPPPTLPLPKVTLGGGGGGVELCWRPYSAGA